MNTISQDIISALQNSGLAPSAKRGTPKAPDFSALVSALVSALAGNATAAPAPTSPAAAAPASGSNAPQAVAPQTSTRTASDALSAGVPQTAINTVLTTGQATQATGVLGAVSLTVGSNSALANALASRPANWYSQIWGTPDNPKHPNLSAADAASFYANIPTNAQILAAGGTLNGWTADLGDSASAVNRGQQTIAANGGKTATTAVQLAPESTPTGAQGEIIDPSTGLAIHLPAGMQLSDYFGLGNGQSALTDLFGDAGSGATDK